ncbi:MAG: Hsp70 family protein [Lachnospiraceae bacterium]|nr:Hsp70 family protein [Lachnospiraceae bacterium]
MGKYIGIDLGTTFSCMAYIDENGQPIVIPNREGKNTTPSTVLFDGQSTIVGEEAKNQSILDPANFEQFVKRHMGERDYQFSSGNGEKYSPEAISAIILSKMKADAEEHLGEPVDGAVITVPAYFNEAQRKSTMDAGQIAGLNVLAIINEPTAAALAFGIAKGSEKAQTIMVYDLGGGTFDVTVLRFDNENITVLGTAGDRKLGGFDFDERIIDAVSSAAAEQGLDIQNDSTARQDLQLKAEEAKKRFLHEKKQISF